MINLNSRDSLLLRGIKLEKVYEKEYPIFEEFYLTFKGYALYKRKTVLMAFFALYGNKYTPKETEKIIIKEGLKLLFKFRDISSIHQELMYIRRYFVSLLEYILGELAILPVGIIENKKYIKTINMVDNKIKKWIDLREKDIFLYEREKEQFIGVVKSIEYDYLLFRTVLKKDLKEDIHSNSERVFYKDAPKDIDKLRVIGYYDDIYTQVKNILNKEE